MNVQTKPSALKVALKAMERIDPYAYRRLLSRVECDADPDEGTVAAMAWRMIEKNGGRPIRAAGAVETERFGYFSGNKPGGATPGRRSSPMRNEILNLLRDASDPMTAKDILEAVNGDTVTKVGEMLRDMEKAGYTARAAVTDRDRVANPAIGHCKWLWVAAK